MANEMGLSSAAGTRNARYYTHIFNQFENAEGAWRPSWNWGAFVCSTGWFLFRRMFVHGAINLAVLLLVALPFAVHLTVEEASLAHGVLAVYLLIGLIAVPLVANWLYYVHLKRRLGAGGTTVPDMMSFGAAAAATTVAAAAVLYAVVIGTGIDYEVRVHVVDAMLAAAPQKSAVENFVKQKGALPDTAADASTLVPAVGGAPVHPGIKFAEITAGGVVRIAFTGFRHINGRWVEFVPTLNDKLVEWRCYNIDMPDHELPSLCRVKRPVERKAPAAKGAPAADTTAAAPGK